MNFAIVGEVSSHHIVFFNVFWTTMNVAITKIFAFPMFFQCLGQWRVQTVCSPMHLRDWWALSDYKNICFSNVIAMFGTVASPNSLFSNVFTWLVGSDASKHFVLLCIFCCLGCADSKPSILLCIFVFCWFLFAEDIHFTLYYLLFEMRWFKTIYLIWYFCFVGMRWFKTIHFTLYFWFFGMRWLKTIHFTWYCWF